MEKTFLGIPQNFMAVLAYSVPPIAFITGFALLIFERDNKFVRFHAMQSFILFGFYAVVLMIVGCIPIIRIPLIQIITFIVFASWFILILGAAMGKYFRFPLIGEIIYEKMGE